MKYPFPKLKTFVFWGVGESEVKVKSAQSYLTLCDPVDCSLPGFTVRSEPHIRITTFSPVWCQSYFMMCICTRACHSDLRLPRSSSACVCAKLLQSCLTLCDPMDCSLPGSCVHGIFQARILEWVAMPSSRGSS